MTARGTRSCAWTPARRPGRGDRRLIGCRSRRGDGASVARPRRWSDQAPNVKPTSRRCRSQVEVVRWAPPIGSPLRPIPADRDLGLIAPTVPPTADRIVVVSPVPYRGAAQTTCRTATGRRGAGLAPGPDHRGAYDDCGTIRRGLHTRPGRDAQRSGRSHRDTTAWGRPMSTGYQPKTQRSHSKDSTPSSSCSTRVELHDGARPVQPTRPTPRSAPT